MSLPELFHHETLFIGSLAIRRVQRYKAGENLMVGQSGFHLAETDARELTELADSIHFNFNQAYDLSIQTQALDYVSLNRCPALSEDNLCSIHHNRKPSVCSMVPFEALFPDRLQHLVLANRDLGEDCIASGLKEDSQIVVKDRQITSEEYQQSMEQRRRDLLAEKQGWGEVVFELLRPALLADRQQLERIPFDGFFNLSIIPLLNVIGGVSEPYRNRVLQYVDNQIELIDLKVSQAIQRKNLNDKPTTQTLRGFKQAYLTFRSGLLQKQPLFKMSPRQVAVLKEYIGHL